MRVLVDTDIFQKLAATGLLEAGLQHFGASLETAERLPSLPHMLRRGKLRRELGNACADSLIPLAEKMQVLPEAEVSLLDQLNVEGIDPGEVQLFANALLEDVRLLTGDKRALRAVSRLPQVTKALAGKIVVLEESLLMLCNISGDAFVQAAVTPHRQIDKGVFQSCFSVGTTSPQDCLKSYSGHLRTEVAPLDLWRFVQGGT